MRKNIRPSIFAILVGLLLACFLPCSGCKRQPAADKTNSQLATRFEAIRQAGYPVTLAELDTWYSLPAGTENGADL